MNSEQNVATHWSIYKWWIHRCHCFRNAFDPIKVFFMEVNRGRHSVFVFFYLFFFQFQSIWWCIIQCLLAWSLIWICAVEQWRLFSSKSFNQVSGKGWRRVISRNAYENGMTHRWKQSSWSVNVIPLCSRCEANPSILHYFPHYPRLSHGTQLRFASFSYTLLCLLWGNFEANPIRLHTHTS